MEVFQQDKTKQHTHTYTPTHTHTHTKGGGGFSSDSTFFKGTNKQTQLIAIKMIVFKRQNNLPVHVIVFNEDTNVTCIEADVMIIFN